MRRRLLLFMYVLALALCAQAYTVTFDVSYASFMTEKDQLSIRLEDSNYRSYWAEYDQETDKFVAHNVEAGTYQCRVSYPKLEGNETNTTFTVTSDMNVPLDLTKYYQVTFKAPDGFTLNEVQICTANSEGGFNITGIYENYCYMSDGTYQWKGCAVSSEGVAYLFNFQDFTVAGANKDVTLDVSSDNWHRVALSLTGRDGNAITSFDGVLENTDEDIYYSFTSDENGKVILMLQNDTYKYRIDAESYSKLQGGFKVEGADMNVAASYENYKKLTINVSGSTLSPPSLYMTCLTNFDGGRSYYFDQVGIGYHRWEQYVEPATFEYEINTEIGGIKVMPEMSKVVVDQDRTLNIDYSGYYLATFNVVNEAGEAINADVEIITAEGFKSEIGSGKTLYVKPGDYMAEVTVPIDPNGKDGRHATLFKDFVMGAAPQEIRLVYEESKYSEVAVNLINVPQGLEPYTEDLYIELFSGNCLYGSEYIEDGLFVPKGTYTYKVASDIRGIIRLEGTFTVTGNNDRIDLDFSRYGAALVELRDAEGNLYDFDDFDYFVERDGKVTDAWQEYDEEDYAVLLLPAGTYKVSVLSVSNGHGEKSITINAGTVSNETITIAPRQPGKFVVGFQVEEATYGVNDEIECTVSLQGYGEIVITNGSGGFYNVDAAEGLAYTISAPGYQTVTGTVNVNEMNSDNGIVGLYIRMRAANPTDIETVSTDKSFRVYPTIADDYINICPNDQDDTAWTIRLISATGAVVRMDKQVLDGETPMYVGNLPKGFYLLTLENGMQRLTYKIMKK